jgi:competence protein ComEC
LTGDLGKEGEKRIIRETKNLNSDVIKLGHHGSNTSSSTEFLNNVSPHDAVISVGDNNYGHPDLLVLDRLQRMGIKKWETLQQGAVTIKTDGKQYSIEGFLK